MSWETILKRRGGTKGIFYPQFRAALEEAIDTYETFTISEIIPFFRELYVDKLLDENIMQANTAPQHAAAKIKITKTEFITKIIHNIGTHRKTRKKNDKNEFIFRRI